MARQDFGFQIDKDEWAQIVALANEMPAMVGQKAFNTSINEGLDEIQASMERNINNSAMNETPILSRSLFKKRKKKYEPSFWHGAVAVRVGKKRGDGAFYWNIVEQGHRVVGPTKRDTGKRVEAMRYAINAYESHKNSVTMQIARRTKSILDKKWKKYAAVKGR